MINNFSGVVGVLFTIHFLMKPSLRIFFDTPTFDRITKDRAAKPLDMFSAIGGTMGLLTGFSLISAIEILFFAVKITLNFLSKNKNEQK